MFNPCTTVRQTWNVSRITSVLEYGLKKKWKCWKKILGSFVGRPEEEEMDNSPIYDEEDRKWFSFTYKHETSQTDVQVELQLMVMCREIVQGRHQSSYGLHPSKKKTTISSHWPIELPDMVEQFLWVRVDSNFNYWKITSRSSYVMFSHAKIFLGCG